MVPGGALVLDLGCGLGFLRNHLDPSCGYIGVDCLKPDCVDRFDRFVQADLARGDWHRELEAALPARPDVITLAAVLEHVDDCTALLVRCGSLLREQGMIVGTTPHPCGRRLHEALAAMGICSRSGAREHRSFLDRADLSEHADACGGRLDHYKTFLFGLNQLFVIRFGGLHG